MKPNTGALMVTNAISMQEWTCRKEILLSQKYSSTLRQSSASTRIQKTGILENEKFTWFLSFTLYWGRKSVSTIGCDKQNNNRDRSLVSIAKTTELAFKGDPGTVKGVSMDRRFFPVYIKHYLFYFDYTESSKNLYTRSLRRGCWRVLWSYVVEETGEPGENHRPWTGDHHPVTC